MFRLLKNNNKNEQDAEAPLGAGCCPACRNVVSMTTEDGRELPRSVGNVIVCDHCGAELEIVQEEPLKFELLEEAK